jgi:1,2-phenylacetyl-CoA epoxidase PaaB subunit
MSDQDHVFWVFGRERSGAVLRQVGVVRAPTPALAFVYARMLYQERKWRDLKVAPREAFYAPAEVMV